MVKKCGHISYDARLVAVILSVLVKFIAQWDFVRSRRKMNDDTYGAPICFYTRLCELLKLMAQADDPKLRSTCMAFAYVLAPARRQLYSRDFTKDLIAASCWPPWPISDCVGISCHSPGAMTVITPGCTACAVVSTRHYNCTKSIAYLKPSR